MFRLAPFGHDPHTAVMEPLRDAIPALDLDGRSRRALRHARVVGPIPTFVGDAEAMVRSGRLDAGLKLRAWTVLVMAGPRPMLVASLDARPPRRLTSLRGEVSARALANALDALEGEAIGRGWDPARHWVRVARLPGLATTFAWLTGRPGLVCATRFGAGVQSHPQVVTAPAFRLRVAAALEAHGTERSRLRQPPAVTGEAAPR